MKAEKRRPSLPRRAGFVLLLLLFPFPLALVYAVGIPIESRWPYVITYAIWVSFALLLDRVITHGWPIQLRFASSRGIRWPHLGVVYLCLGLIILWYLISRTGSVSDPVLVWLVWNIIAIVAFVESAIVGSKRSDADRIAA